MFTVLGTGSRSLSMLGKPSLPKMYPKAQRKVLSLSLMQCPQKPGAFQVIPSWTEENVTTEDLTLLDT